MYPHIHAMVLLQLSLYHDLSYSYNMILYRKCCVELAHSICQFHDWVVFHVIHIKAVLEGLLWKTFFVNKICICMIMPLTTSNNFEYLPHPLVLQDPGHRVHCGPCVGGCMAGGHRDCHCGLRGQLPSPLHLPIHPGDLLHPHLPHLHLWNLRQAGQGIHLPLNHAKDKAIRWLDAVLNIKWMGKVCTI